MGNCVFLTKQSLDILIPRDHLQELLISSKEANFSHLINKPKVTLSFLMRWNRESAHNRIDQEIRRTNSLPQLINMRSNLRRNLESLFIHERSFVGSKLEEFAALVSMFHSTFHLHLCLNFLGLAQSLSFLLLFSWYSYQSWQWFYHSLNRCGDWCGVNALPRLILNVYYVSDLMANRIVLLQEKWEKQKLWGCLEKPF